MDNKFAKYNLNNTLPVEFCSITAEKMSSEHLSNPENVLIVSLDVKNLKSIVEQLNKYRFEKNNIHLIFPGILEDDTQQFPLLNEILSVSKCKIFILQKEFSDLKYLLQAADIVNFSSNIHIIHNSLAKLKAGLESFGQRCLEPVVNIGVSAFQQHLSEGCDLPKQNFDQYRLGHVLSNIEVVNKPIASSNIVVVDISALRQSDIPGRREISSSGLHSEAFNQIARSAGLSLSTRITVLSGLNDIEEGNEASIDTVAQFIYYFLSGAGQALSFSEPARTTNYIIDECLPYASIQFTKNEITNEWSVRYPVKLPDHLSLFQYVPCTYNDYQYSGQGELSPRIADIFRTLDTLVN